MLVGPHELVLGLGIAEPSGLRLFRGDAAGGPEGGFEVGYIAEDGTSVLRRADGVSVISAPSRQSLDQLGSSCPN